MDLKLILAFAAAGALVSISGQTPPSAQANSPTHETATDATEPGIPVTDQLVISKCGTCHTKDSKGNLSRISWERATPEGWEEAIKRMVRLNGLQITGPEARSIVKYLATYHGLAPEEAKSVMYMAEHREVDESIPNDEVRGACANCHALGRPLSWRRSKEDWQLLANMHVALYATADQAFRRGVNAGGGGNAPTIPNFNGPPVLPVTTALDFLDKTAPLHTPEWGAWRARMRPPKLAGSWRVSATIPGHGKYYGVMQIEPGAAEDEFTTHVTLRSVRDGSTITRSGTSVVYGGYSWRGRSKGTTAPPANAAPDDTSKEAREALLFTEDQSRGEGRWYWGEYQEFGFDVKLDRENNDVALLGIDKTSLKTGSQGTQVRLLGDNLPANVAEADLSFGTGVTVRRIVSHNANEVVAEVDVAKDAVSGKRDISIGRSVLLGGIAVYDRIDYIKVTPETALAHLGSDVHPKGYQRFEAIGYQRGDDGKINTADDVELGPLDVNWSVEEFLSVYGDDDKNFVGTLSPTGLFTPALDGPDPKRKFSRNNYGDVWVVATAKNEKDQDGMPLIGKAYLVVSVPTYIHWDQPEVSQ